MSPKFVAIPSFSEIIAQVGEAIWVVGPTGHWVYVNPTFGKFIGISADEVYGHPLFDYIHPDDRQYVTDTFEEVKSGKDVIEIKYRLIHAEGMDVWVSTVVNAVRDTGRQIQYYVGSTRKVSGDRFDFRAGEFERKSPQAALQGAPDIPFDAVVEQMSEPVWVVDIARNWVYANPSFTMETGLSKEALAGKTIGQFLEGSQNEILENALKRIIEGEERVDLTIEIHGAEDKPVTGRFIINPVRSPEGAIDFFVGSGREEGSVVPGSALPDPTAPFRETLNKLGAPAWIMDSKGQWIMVNSAFSGALGMKAGEMPTGTLQSIVHPDDQGIVRNAMRDLADSEIVKVSCRVQPTAGRVYWMDVVLSALRSEEEGIMYIAATGHDLTAEKELEIETAHLKDKLQDIIDLMDSAIIATDLSGKIRVINKNVSGLLDLLEMEIIEQNVADLFVAEGGDDIRQVMVKAAKGETGTAALVISDSSGGTSKHYVKFGPVHYLGAVDGVLLQISLT